MTIIKKILKEYFKKISYGFFLLLYGKIYKYSNYNDFDEVESKEVKLEDRAYSIFKIAKSRIYTDRIHNTAVIINQTLVKGPSYQLRNNNIKV